MTLPIFTVDAFTDRAFAGNPAAVVLLDSERHTGWLQAVAAEMNLAETAFLLPTGHAWSLRWFTPTVEERLCGHATLAAAHVLWETGRLAPGAAAAFDTLSGRLGAVRRDGAIELDFPATPPVGRPALHGAVTGVLGFAPRWVGESSLDLLVRVEDAVSVRRYVPDFAAIGTLPGRGLILTAPADDGTHDFISRFFAPHDGVPEDPVTGSAHCTLGPYWRGELGRDALLGYQASLRGGTVRVTTVGERCLLAGGAVTVLRGELLA